MDTNEFGRFVEELRGKMSLRDAAERSGLSHTYIRDIEKGVNRKTKSPIQYSHDTVKRLARAYNYDENELLKKAGIIEPSFSDKVKMGEGVSEQAGTYHIDEETRKMLLDENTRRITEAYYKLPPAKRKIFDDLAEQFMEDRRRRESRDE